MRSKKFDFEGTFTKIGKHQLIEYSFDNRLAQVKFIISQIGVKVRISFDIE